MHADLYGARLPGDLNGEPAQSLLVTTEDAAKTVVVPRLIAAGADLDYVHIVGVKVDAYDDLITLPADLPGVEQRVIEHGARFLSIDPVVATLSGGIDTHKDASIRRVLAPLAQLAERRDLAVMGLIHMNKSAANDLLNRVSGSKGFVNAARSVLVMANDPEDPEGEDGYGRVIVHAKSNWARLAPTLAADVTPVEFAGNIETSKLVIKGVSEVNRADLVSRESEGSDKTELARHWLLERLGRDTWHDSAEVKVEGEREGHASRTLQRAFAALRKEGAGELKSEGFPRRTMWSICSRADSAGATEGATEGRDYESGSTEPKTGGDESQSRQTPKPGATGPNGRRDRHRCNCLRPPRVRRPRWHLRAVSRHPSERRGKSPVRAFAPPKLSKERAGLVKDLPGDGPARLLAALAKHGLAREHAEAAASLVLALDEFCAEATR